jgi:hypothetical protein
MSSPASCSRPCASNAASPTTTVPAAIEAIAPHPFGKDEASKIRALIEHWQRERHGVTIEIED